MQKTLSIVLAAGLGLAALLVMAPAQAGTDVGVCTDQPQVVAGPGAGEAGLWLNDCISTTATTLAITFTGADGLPHQPLSKGCFDLGRLSPTGVQSAVLNIKLLGSSVYNGLSKCSNTPGQARNGVFGAPAGTIDPENGDTLVFHDGAVTIHYVCAIHGAAMHGTITLKAPA